MKTLNWGSLRTRPRSPRDEGTIRTKCRCWRDGRTTRKAYRHGGAAALILVLASTFLTVGATRSEAQEGAAVPLMIQTVPKMPTITFSLDGERFTTDARGLALTTVTKAGPHRLRVVTHKRRSAGLKLLFAGWSDGSDSVRRQVDIGTFTVLQAGFEASFETRWSFVGSNGSAVGGEEPESVTLVDDRGDRSVYSGSGPHFVPGTRVVTKDGRFVQEKITYRVDRAVVRGVDVTAQVPGSILLGESQRWPISLGQAQAQPPVGSESPVTETPGPGASPYLTGGVIVIGLALLAFAVAPSVRRRTATGGLPTSSGTTAAILRPGVQSSRPTTSHVPGPGESTEAGLGARIKGRDRPVDELSAAPPPPPSPRQAPPAEPPATADPPPPIAASSPRARQSFHKAAQPKHLMPRRQAEPKHLIQPRHLVPRPAPRRSRWGIPFSPSAGSMAEPTMREEEEQSGSRRRRVGRYTLLYRIAEGRRGDVFSAQDSLRRQLVVKLLERVGTADSALDLFRAKAAAAANVKHANVVPLHDYGATAESAYTVSPFVEGESLGDILAREGPLGPVEAAEIACDVAAGLQAAHDQGVVHGALHPSCILVSAWSRALIANLGLPESQRASSDAPSEGGATKPPLTPEVDEVAYEAPEQKEGPATAQSDIYSLGVLLCAMVTGSIQRQTLNERREAAPRTETPTGQAVMQVVPVDLRALILRATAPNPNDRFTGAGEMLRHLDHLISRHLQRVTDAEPALEDADRLIG